MTLQIAPKQPGLIEETEICHVPSGPYQDPMRRAAFAATSSSLPRAKVEHVSPALRACHPASQGRPLGARENAQSARPSSTRAMSLSASTFRVHRWLG
jgi:hypothetical protein